jgi:hypothetical protein
VAPDHDELGERVGQLQEDVAKVVRELDHRECRGRNRQGVPRRV